MKFFFIVTMILCASSAFARIAATDSLDLYGGPDTLEGKFQTEAGDPDEQGWVGIDDTVPTGPELWNVSTRGAVNLDPGVSDNHAWWCGQDMTACSPADSAWGYGDNWDTALGTARTIDPTLQATIHLTGILNIQLEPGFDFLKIEAISPTGPVELASFDGIHMGLNLDVTHTFNPGDFVGENADEVQIHLRVISDEAWSDEDCQFPTAGAVQADNLLLDVSQPGLPPHGVMVETCEEDDPLTWGPIPISGLGNFAQLWTGLDDMDPDQDNASPQWAFINDGLIVPELDPSYCWTKCYGPDSLSIYFGSEKLRNSILSPPIALPEDRTGDLRLAFDAYQDPSDCYSVFLRWAMQSTADPAGETGWVETWYDFLLFDEGPAYKRWEFPVGQELVPFPTRFVRIKLQVYNLNGMTCWGAMDSPAPYLDNVRLQLVPAGASPVPFSRGFQVSAGPNPFNPSVVISWELPRSGELTVNLHDVRGRLVRQLRSGNAPAGPGQITWEGRDDTGQMLASGLYFCRIKSEAGSRLLKLTLIK